MKSLKIARKGLTAYFSIIFIASSGCDKNRNEDIIDYTTQEENAIRQIHADYVDGWVAMDEEKILGLFEEDSRIQPNRLSPIEGKENIRKFWFPRDGSITLINQYETEIISLNILDTIAVTTHRSLLDWTYELDTVRFGMLQKGISTTIYRKQQDDSWKIWRSMWTDLYGASK